MQQACLMQHDFADSKSGRARRVGAKLRKEISARIERAIVLL